MYSSEQPLPRAEYVGEHFDKLSNNQIENVNKCVKIKRITNRSKSRVRFTLRVSLICIRSSVLFDQVAEIYSEKNQNQDICTKNTIGNCVILSVVNNNIA